MKPRSRTTIPSEKKSPARGRTAEGHFARDLEDGTTNEEDDYDVDRKDLKVRGDDKRKWTKRLVVAGLVVLTIMGLVVAKESMVVDDDNETAQHDSGQQFRQYPPSHTQLHVTPAAAVPPKREIAAEPPKREIAVFKEPGRDELLTIDENSESVDETAAEGTTTTVVEPQPEILLPSDKSSVDPALPIDEKEIEELKDIEDAEEEIVQEGDKEEEIGQEGDKEEAGDDDDDDEEGNGKEDEEGNGKDDNEEGNGKDDNEEGGDDDDGEGGDDDDGEGGDDDDGEGGDDDDGEGGDDDDGEGGDDDDDGKEGDDDDDDEEGDDDHDDEEGKEDKEENEEGGKEENEEGGEEEVEDDKDNEDDKEEEDTEEGELAVTGEIR